MSDKLWKQTERAIGKLIGGTRVPITGRQRGSAPDVAHDVFAVEVKQRGRLPGWIKEAMVQAVASAKISQLPIVVLHETGQRHVNDLVVIRLSDFVDFYGSVGVEE